jgi:hypothetical protein
MDKAQNYIISAQKALLLCMPEDAAGYAVASWRLLHSPQAAQCLFFSYLMQKNYENAFYWYRRCGCADMI